MNPMVVDRLSVITDEERAILNGRKSIDRYKPIEFCCVGNEHSGETCIVYDDKHMKYNGKIWSLTALVKHLLNTKQSVTDPRNFKYKGEWLNDIRARTEK